MNSYFILTYSSNLVCALDVDHNSSVLCNTSGYSNLLINEGDNKTKIHHLHRQYVHQWICIRDIIDDLITCNRTLKNKNINEILIKIDLWLKRKNQIKSESSITGVKNIKFFKAKARQLIWDLMEMK
jgi:hypothetical protein